MRPFALVAPTIWTGTSGREWRLLGREYQILGLYLCTSPSSNQYGLFYQPWGSIVDESGLKSSEAVKVLSHFENTGFAHYDRESQWIWIVKMWEIQLTLQGIRVVSPSDNRIRGLHKWYAGLPTNPWLGPFFDRYGQRFGIPERRDGRPLQVELAIDTSTSIVVPQAPKLADPPAAPTMHEAQQVFELFWAEYPKHKRVGKKATAMQWQATTPKITREFCEQVIVPKLHLQRDSYRWTKDGGQYVPDPERYVKHRRWEDEVADGPVTPSADHADIDAWMADMQGRGDEIA